MSNPEKRGQGVLDILMAAGATLIWLACAPFIYLVETRWGRATHDEALSLIKEELRDIWRYE